MARSTTVNRKTKETDIHMILNLDGTGQTEISTGIGFFDHMLEGFGRHGFFDLKCKVKGDLEVDGHHTVEDTGIQACTGLRNLMSGQARKSPTTESIRTAFTQ